MDKKSQEYWKKRSQILEQATFDNTKDEYKKIAKAFDKSQKEIQAKIDKWLARIAKNNGDITLEEARELLNKNELAEFKWTVKEYIKYGEENAIDQRWMKELENESAKHHIDKLTALKLECQAEYDKAFNTENQKVTDAVKEAYTDRYDHVGYEVQKGFNAGFKLNGISEEKLDKVIRKPWAPDGKNFSDRIWTKKEQMVEELYQALVRNTLGGSNLKDVINSMTKYVDKSTKNAKSAAARLVMTESAYFASQGQKDCFNDLGVEKYEIVATLDNKTSDICQGLDGKVFEMKEFEPGTTAPPFHVNCRSTTAPYFDDELAKGERAARGADGETYYVPSDMTFREWKDEQNDMNLMSASFRPTFSNKVNNEKIEKVNIKTYKVENSKFDLYVDEDYADKRNKAVRNTEKILKEIEDSLDTNTFEIGKVVLTDLGKIHKDFENAIGMYNSLTDIIYINGKYDTNNKIIDYLNINRDLFANNDELTPIKHEMGHKFYEKCIKKLAKKENIDYNKAKDRIDNKIFNTIKELNVANSSNFLNKELSKYAEDYYRIHKYTEIVAECLSVYGDNELATIIIKGIKE